MGTALAEALVKAGYPILGVLDKDSGKARKAARLARVFQNPSGMEDLPLETTLIFICVPDDAIADTATKLASAVAWTSDTLAVHTSGLRTSEVLQPFKEKKVQTASMHPCLSFSGQSQENLQDVPFILEGENRAMNRLERLIHRFQGIPFRLKADEKPRYHLACVMMSNYLVALFQMAHEVTADSNISFRTFIPLVQSTLNNVQKKGAAGALTGPILRGDVETVRVHLQILESADKRILEAYRALGLTALHLAESRLSREKTVLIRSLLAGQAESE